MTCHSHYKFIHFCLLWPRFCLLMLFLLKALGILFFKFFITMFVQIKIIILLEYRHSCYYHQQENKFLLLKMEVIVLLITCNNGTAVLQQHRVVLGCYRTAFGVFLRSQLKLQPKSQISHATAAEFQWVVKPPILSLFQCHFWGKNEILPPFLTTGKS